MCLRYWKDRRREPSNPQTDPIPNLTFDPIPDLIPDRLIPPTFNIHILLDIPNYGWIEALSIPCTEARRLCLRPLRWLRFVTFAVSGSRGHLSITPGGPPVDYDVDSTAPLAQTYYYLPDGPYRPIDPNALDGRASAATHTARRSSFRQRIMDRDGPGCVFSLIDAVLCEASHLIPFSKGNEYIHRIIQSRMGLYNGMAPGQQFDISIDDIENGIFVSRNLHKALGSLMIAFLKTPNFAMEVGDVPAILVDPLSSIRITMQYIGGFPTREPFPLPELDAKIGGNGASQPSVLLLDYVYGVAIFRRWGSVGPYRQVLREYAQANLLPALEIIPHPATPSQTSSHTEPDDPDDADFDPDLWEPDALQAMDDMLLLSLLLKGAISESQHEAMQKVCDEEQAVSTQKVEEWRNITE